MPTLSPSPPSTYDAPRSGRSIRPLTSPLPSRRSITGGLLVAISLIGTWYIGADAGSPPLPAYVTARHALGPGHRILAADLRTVRLSLTSQVAATAFHASEAPIGAVVERATGPGELLARSSVSTVPPGMRQVGLEVDAAWTLQDSLEPGSIVDLFVTYGEGPQAVTRQVARNVQVAGISESAGGGIGEQGGRRVTLQVSQPRQLNAIIHAARAGSLTFTSTYPGHRTPRLMPYATPTISADPGVAP